MNTVPTISKPWLRLLRWAARRSLRRHFTAVRISRRDRVTAAQSGPLIIYSNHSSWWDVLTGVLLSEKLMPHRNHYAPMDSGGPKRHPILGKVGVFGIHKNTPRGGTFLLRTGLRILSQGGVLWLTPQGRFADVREQPLKFRRGIAALAARVPGGCTLLPLALEYPFWDERRPEVLIQFGAPIRVDGQSADELMPLLEALLLEAMEELRDKAIARDGSAFEVLEKGSRGTGSLFGFSQKLWAWLLHRLR